MSDAPKHSKPKVMMIDMPEAVVDAGREAGLNVSAGSFGLPYEVDQSDKWSTVIPFSNLPNCQEQEIVIIDLQPTSMAKAPQGKKSVSVGELDWWVSQSSGYVDPRPRSMLEESASFDRIYEHGGLFVVFASHRHSQDYKLGQVESGYGFQVHKDIPADSWGFLRVLEYITTFAMDGDEIFPQKKDFAPFTNFLNRHCEDATYFATLEAGYPLKREGAQSLSQAIKRYLEWAEVNRPRTFPDKESKARILKKQLGDPRMDDLSAFRIERLKRDRIKGGAGPATANRDLAHAQAPVRYGCGVGMDVEGHRRCHPSGEAAT